MKITVDISDEEIKKKVIEKLADIIISKMMEEDLFHFKWSVDDFLEDMLEEIDSEAHNKIKKELEKLLTNEEFIRKHMIEIIRRALEEE